MKQLSIDLNPVITKSYPTCKDYVAARVHQQSIPQKVIAMDMDYSPSQLSQKLGCNDSSSARFTLDDLEKFVDVTGDLEPIKYLVAKFLYKGNRSQIAAQIADLQAQLEQSE